MLPTSKFFHKKGLGQNFLFDKNIINKIIAVLDLTKKDVVLEIGAGLGTLTSLLSAKAGKVIALEIDERAVVFLEDKFKDNKNIKIIKQDFLEYEIERKFIKNKIKVFGNIPYYITSPIIEHLLKFRDRITDIYITVQKEVAERIVALPSGKDYGALSCFVQFYAKAEILFIIKAGSFTPAPKVDSAFLKLTVLERPRCQVDDEGLFFKMVRAGFSQRRKTFMNAVSPLFQKEKTASVLKELGLDLNIRVENLSLEELARIFNHLCIFSLTH